MGQQPLAAGQKRGRPPKQIVPVRLANGQLAYTIPQFCNAHQISVGLYFKLKAQGRAPRLMKLGRRSLITAQEIARWQAERQSESNMAAAARS